MNASGCINFKFTGPAVGDRTATVATACELINWTADPGGGGTRYTPGATYNMPRANVTLYAQSNSGSARYVCTDRQCGDNTPCHKTISEAVEAASNGTLIKIAAEDQDGNFNLDDDKDLTLQGGWNSSFKNGNGGTTTLKPSPKAPQGSLTFQNLRIVP